MKYYHGDVVRTTRFLDVFEEWLVLNKYRYWVDGEIRAAVTKGEQENLEFFGYAVKGGAAGCNELWDEYKGLGAKFVIKGDLWTVQGRKHHAIELSIR